MITINLLPEKQREFLAQERLFRMVLKQTSLFMTIPIIFIFTLGLLLILRNAELDELNRTSAQNQQAEIYKELAGYEKDFRETNETVTLIDKVLKNNLYWSLILDETGILLPNGIKLKKFVTNEYHVQLSGASNTRDKLIDFQDNLSNNSCFTDVIAPLSNLVSKENIEFSIDLDINPECLKTSK